MGLRWFPFLLCVFWVSSQTLNADKDSGDILPRFAQGSPQVEPNEATAEKIEKALKESSIKVADVDATGPNTYTAYFDVSDIKGDVKTQLAAWQKALDSAAQKVASGSKTDIWIRGKERRNPREKKRKAIKPPSSTPKEATLLERNHHHHHHKPRGHAHHRLREMVTASPSSRSSSQKPRLSTIKTKARQIIDVYGADQKPLVGGVNIGPDQTAVTVTQLERVSDTEVKVHATGHKYEKDTIIVCDETDNAPFDDETKEFDILSKTADSFNVKVDEPLAQTVNDLDIQCRTKAEVGGTLGGFLIDSARPNEYRLFGLTNFHVLPVTEQTDLLAAQSCQPAPGDHEDDNNEDDDKPPECNAFGAPVVGCCQESRGSVDKKDYAIVEIDPKARFNHYCSVRGQGAQAKLVDISGTGSVARDSYVSKYGYRTHHTVGKILQVYPNDGEGADPQGRRYLIEGIGFPEFLDGEPEADHGKTAPENDVLFFEECVFDGLAEIIQRFRDDRFSTATVTRVETTEDNTKVKVIAADHPFAVGQKVTFDVTQTVPFDNDQTEFNVVAEVDENSFRIETAAGALANSVDLDMQATLVEDVGINEEDAMTIAIGLWDAGFLDSTFSCTGDSGSFVLDNVAMVSRVETTDDNTEVKAVAANHHFVVGQKVRFASTETQPFTDDQTEYDVIAVMPPTEVLGASFHVRTGANALAGNADLVMQAWGSSGKVVGLINSGIWEMHGSGPTTTILGNLWGHFRDVTFAYDIDQVVTQINADLAATSINDDPHHLKDLVLEICSEGVATRPHPADGECTVTDNKCTYPNQCEVKEKESPEDPTECVSRGDFSRVAV